MKRTTKEYLAYLASPARTKELEEASRLANERLAEHRRLNPKRPRMPKTAKCRNCGTTELQAFSPVNLSNCRSCIGKQAKDRKKLKPPSPRKNKPDSYFQTRGITRAEAWRMLQEPDAKCEICGKRPSGRRGDVLCIDHDHQTHKFRGILCNKCNAGIGLLGDTKESVLVAYQYITRH